MKNMLIKFKIPAVFFNIHGMLLFKKGWRNLKQKLHCNFRNKPLFQIKNSCIIMLVTFLSCLCHQELPLYLTLHICSDSCVRRFLSRIVLYPVTNLPWNILYIGIIMTDTTGRAQWTELAVL